MNQVIAGDKEREGEKPGGEEKEGEEVKDVKAGKAGARDVGVEVVLKEWKGDFEVEMEFKLCMSSGDLLNTGLGKRVRRVSGFER